MLQSRLSKGRHAGSAMGQEGKVKPRNSASCRCSFDELHQRLLLMTKTLAVWLCAQRKQGLSVQRVIVWSKAKRKNALFCCIGLSIIAELPNRVIVSEAKYELFGEFRSLHIHSNDMEFSKAYSLKLLRRNLQRLEEISDFEKLVSATSAERPRLRQLLKFSCACCSQFLQLQRQPIEMFRLLREFENLVLERVDVSRAECHP